jgi:hypothetical protein
MPVKPCTDNQIRNPVSKRCVEIGGKAYKDIMKKVTSGEEVLEDQNVTKLKNRGMNVKVAPKSNQQPKQHRTLKQPKTPKRIKPEPVKTGAPFDDFRQNNQELYESLMKSITDPEIDETQVLKEVANYVANFIASLPQCSARIEIQFMQAGTYYTFAIQQASSPKQVNIGIHKNLNKPFASQFDALHKNKLQFPEGMPSVDGMFYHTLPNIFTGMGFYPTMHNSINDGIKSLFRTRFDVLAEKYKNLQKELRAIEHDLSSQPPPPCDCKTKCKDGVLLVYGKDGKWHTFSQGNLRINGVVHHAITGINSTQIPFGVCEDRTTLKDLNIDLLYYSAACLIRYFPDSHRYAQSYPKFTHKLINPRVQMVYATLEIGASTRLNNLMIEYLLMGCPLDDETNLGVRNVQARISTIMDEYLAVLSGTERYKEDIVVYHGTGTKIHSGKSFKTMAFFSTTVDCSTACKYAGHNGNIYVLKVPWTFPYLNLSDKLSQILFPVGTEIVVTDETYNIQGMNIFVCEVQNNYTKDVADTLKSMYMCKAQMQLEKPTGKGTLSCVKWLSEWVKNNKGLVYTNTSGSSVFYSMAKDDSQYYLKTMLKKPLNTKEYPGDFYVCKRAINEYLASIVYQFYGLDTFDLTLIVGGGKQYGRFALASKEISGIKYYAALEPYKTDFVESFLVDCIVSNWDVCQNDNLGVFNGKLIRTDIGGALVFRALGSIKIDFLLSSVPNDHVTMTQSNDIVKRWISWYIYLEGYNKVKEGLFKTIEKADIKLLKKDKRLVMLKKDLVSMKINDCVLAFIDQIIDRVIVRHKFYIDNKEQVFRDVLQQCGGGSKSTIPKSPQDKDIVERDGEEEETPDAGDIMISKNLFDRLVKKRLQCTL